MLQLLNRPFNFTEYSFRTKCTIALATGSFAMLFLWLFDNKKKLGVFAFADNGVVIGLSEMIFLFTFHNLFLKKKINGTIKLWQYMAGIGAAVWGCFSFMYLYVSPVYFKAAYSFDAYFEYIRENLPFVFPFLLFVLAIEYMMMLKGCIKKQQLTLSIPVQQVVTAAIEYFILSDALGQPIFRVQRSNLLFIKSSDNYIEIFYQQDQKTSKKLIRYQLTAIESNPNHNFLHRVHRSYLCNLQKVTKTSGGLQNYSLHFDHSTASIPVSRAKAKQIMLLLSHK